MSTSLKKVVSYPNIQISKTLKILQFLKFHFEDVLTTKRIEKFISNRMFYLLYKPAKYKAIVFKLLFFAELHRGSLPNINKGYFSLKSRKLKRPSEPKISCPLPMHPSHSKVTLNGIVSQVSVVSDSVICLPIICC